MRTRDVSLGEVDVSWARRIVAKYEAGERVLHVSLKAAMEVLKIPPGTLVKGGCGRGRFDARSAAANDFDTREG